MRWTGAFVLALLVPAWGAELTLLPEHARPDPFGALVVEDRGSNATPAKSILLDAARGGYVSCHLVVSLPESGAYTLTVQGPLEFELYREWFHYLPKKKRYLPDALVPATSPHRGQIPDSDNAIARQTSQAFWLDVWVPASATSGLTKMTAVLEAGGRRHTAEIQVRVHQTSVPSVDPVVMDHNSYGTSWFATQYPALAGKPDFYLSDRFFRLIHDYHRIFYEHRGTYHQLGYGHGGKVGPEFAPRLAGTGKSRHVADWTTYDRHYGPLLDGTAFAGSRWGARPIPFVYLPVNPEWPASYLWWGQPGYEREMTNVLGEMEQHFRAKGWTQTRFEIFFNHKKRYKAFPWDGDETRFVSDMPLFAEYARLFRKAIPAATPVKFVFRTDASWQMERQFKELAGIINFWVCGGGMFGWYAEHAEPLKKRGDIAWTYGGTPTVDAPASHITLEVLRPWILGVQGFVRWHTVDPGQDPWFRFEGGGETLVYPGERFGIAGPIASVRLKLERNALQDLAVLNSFAGKRGLESLKADAAQRYNQTRVNEWRAPRPPLAETDPETWTNASIDEAMPRDKRFDAQLDAGAWSRVRTYIFGLVQEAGR